MTKGMSGQAPSFSIEKSVLSPRDAALYLSCSISFLSQNRMNIRRSTNAKAIPFVRLGRSVRYRKSDLDQFLEANCVSLEASDQ